MIKALYWHLGWTIFDLSVVLIVAYNWYRHLLWGPGFLHVVVITFMLYRTWYHGINAWRLR